MQRVAVTSKGARVAHNDVARERDVSRLRVPGGTGRSFRERMRALAPISPRLWSPSSTVTLVLVFIVWFLASVLGSTVKKSIFNDVSIPLLLTTYQFGAVALLSFVWMQITRRRAVSGERPSLWQVVRDVGPISLGQVFGHFFASVSLTVVPVSYTLTVKAVDPIFTVFLAYVFNFNRTSHPWSVYLALVMIFVGITLASVTEITFDILGFVAAITSSFAGVLLSLYSKHALSSTRLVHDELLYYSSCMSFLIMFPCALWSDGERLLSFPWSQISLRLILLGLAQFGQSIAAFKFLSMVSALTYSIAKNVKRVSLIVTSILWFHNPVTTLNVLGVMLSVFGQGLYGWVKRSGGGHGKVSVVQVLPTHHAPGTQTGVHPSASCPDIARLR